MLETAVLFKHWTFQAYLGLTMVPISTTRLPSDEECSPLMIHSTIESFTTLSFLIFFWVENINKFNNRNRKKTGEQ